METYIPCAKCSGGEEEGPAASVGSNLGMGSKSRCLLRSLSTSSSAYSAQNASHCHRNGNQAGPHEDLDLVVRRMVEMASSGSSAQSLASSALQPQLRRLRQHLEEKDTDDAELGGAAGQTRTRAGKVARRSRLGSAPRPERPRRRGSAPTRLPQRHRGALERRMGRGRLVARARPSHRRP